MKTIRPGRNPTLRHLTIGLTVALGIVALAPATWTAADQQPLLPISPPKLLSVFPVDAPDSDTYDLSLRILDFDPGAATPLQARPGRLFATVMTGEIAVLQDGGQTAFSVGDKFTLEPDAVASIANTSDSPARLFTTVLASAGALDESDSTVGDGPVAAFSGKTSVAALAGQLRLSQGIFDFVPGAGSGAHAHPGPGIVIVMSGEMTQRIPGTDVRQEVGDVFTEVAGRPVDHRNFGPDVATVATSYLTVVGGPPVAAAPLPGSPPLLTVPVPPTPTPVP